MSFMREFSVIAMVTRRHSFLGTVPISGGLSLAGAVPRNRPESPKKDRAAKETSRRFTMCLFWPTEGLAAIRLLEQLHITPHITLLLLLTICSPSRLVP